MPKCVWIVTLFGIPVWVKLVMFGALTVLRLYLIRASIMVSIVQ